MDQVTLDATNGRKVVVSRHRPPTADGEPWVFTTVLATGEAQASSEVWEYGPAGPAVFFRELANNWRCWDGIKSYSSLEGELTLDCRHDGLGLIVCEVTLGCVVPPAWRLSAEMTFGAGAHVERLADELESFLGA